MSGKRQTNGSEFVYVIGSAASAHVKIGISKNPANRLKELQTGSGADLTILHQQAAKNALAIEKRAHKMLAPHRQRGEWFAVSPQMAIQCVKKVARDMTSEERSRRRQAKALAEERRRQERRARMPLPTDFDGLLKSIKVVMEIGEKSGVQPPKSLLAEIDLLVNERLEQIRDELRRQLAEIRAKQRVAAERDPVAPPAPLC